MRVVIWTPGEPLGEWSAEKALEVRGIHTGPMVAVLDENDGIAICQPMNPDTGEDWATEEEAMAFGYRYLAPAPEEPPAEA